MGHTPCHVIDTVIIVYSFVSNKVDARMLITNSSTSIFLETTNSRVPFQLKYAPQKHCYDELLILMYESL